WLERVAVFEANAAALGVIAPSNIAPPRTTSPLRRDWLQPHLQGGSGRACPSATSGDRFLELDFGGEAVAITPDRQNRQFAVALPVSHRAVLHPETSVDLDAVPVRRVPDIVELQIMLLGPEERH